MLDDRGIAAALVASLASGIAGAVDGGARAAAVHLCGRLFKSWTLRGECHRCNKVNVRVQ